MSYTPSEQEIDAPMDAVYDALSRLCMVLEARSMDLRWSAAHAIECTILLNAIERLQGQLISFRSGG